MQLDCEGEQHGPSDVRFDHDFADICWPQQDLFDLKREQDECGIKIKSFRWPPAQEESRKGVVFMLHGYGATNDDSSLVAKNFAANNYEVFGIDMRG